MHILFYGYFHVKELNVSLNPPCKYTYLFGFSNFM